MPIIVPFCPDLKIFGNSKIDNDDVILLVDHQILRFDISKNYWLRAMCMEIFQNIADFNRPKILPGPPELDQECFLRLLQGLCQR